MSSSNNNDSPPETDDFTNYEYLDENETQISNTSLTSSTLTSPNVDGNINPTKNINKKRKSTEPDVLNERFVATLETFQNYIKNKTESTATDTVSTGTTGNNEDVLFGQTVTSILVKFPEKYKVSAKLEILKYLTSVQKEIMDYDENLN